MSTSSILGSNLHPTLSQDNLPDNEEIPRVKNYFYSEKYDKPIMAFQWFTFAVFIMVSCRVGDGNDVTSNRLADYFLMAAMGLLTVSPFIYKYISANCVKQSEALQLERGAVSQNNGVDCSVLSLSGENSASSLVETSV